MFLQWQTPFYLKVEVKPFNITASCKIADNTCDTADYRSKEAVKAATLWIFLLLDGGTLKRKCVDVTVKICEAAFLEVFLKCHGTVLIDIPYMHFGPVDLYHSKRVHAVRQSVLK